MSNNATTNWTYRENANGVKQLLFRGQVATRRGVRRGVRGGSKGRARVTLPGNVNSKAGRVSYKLLRNKARNLGLPVVSVEKRTAAVKALLKKFNRTPPPSHRLTREELVNAILSKNLPKFTPEPRKERSNKGVARKTNEQKAATKAARLARAKAKRDAKKLRKNSQKAANKRVAKKANLAARLRAAAEKAKAANAAAAAANAEVAKLQARIAASAAPKRKANNAPMNNREQKRRRVTRQLKSLGLPQNQINARLRNQGLI